MPPSLATTLISAANAGASVLRSYFGRGSIPGVLLKGPADFVSEADLRSEAAIKEVLSAAQPGVAFQAEESASEAVAVGPRFIIDPLDGTTNFVRGLPHFSISLAFADDSGTIAGVVLDPMRDELFWAERGHGAFLGERRLAVATTNELEGALIHTGVPHRGRPDHDGYLRKLSRVMTRVSGIRRLGSAALDLAYVAAGRGDAFFEKGLSPWDIAAGMLLVSEAGGIVTDQQGDPARLERGEVLAASSALHAQVLAMLNAP
jgi:myo-inositol-1(or 4)-monophosphatase